MTEATPRGFLFDRVSPRLRILLFAALLAGGGAAMLFLTPDFATTPERVWTVPFLALALAFGIAEATALHVEIRKESHSLSLASIPLMAGLLYASPAHVLMAYVIGGSSTLLWIRKSDLLKVVWNTCLFVTQVGLAGLMVRTALGDGLPETPTQWLVPLAAVIAAELVSLVAVPLVIMAVDGRFRPDLFANVGQSQILAALAGTFAVSAISGLGASPYMAAYAVVPLVGVGALLRSTGQQGQRLRDLQQIHRFTQEIVNERGARALDTGLIELAQIMRSTCAGFAVLGAGSDERPAARVLVDESFEQTDAERLANLLLAVVDATGITQLDTTDEREEVIELLELLGSSRLVAVRVLGELELDGALFVTDRLGMRTHFSADELRLFGSLANTLSARLSNDRLVELLEAQARHDGLTGLPNRLSFEIALTAALAKPSRVGAVAMIDLDRFKEVNDSLGHDTGDRLLVEVGDRLRSVLKRNDLAARFGGDEFAVLLESGGDQVELDQRIDELATAISGRAIVDGLEFELAASIGVARWPEHGSDSTQLLKRADAAMYEAKRNQLPVVFYEPAVDADAPRRLDLYLSVRSAIENEQLFVHFQPKISLAHGGITGVETLVRWTHPTYGPISPFEFIPLVVQAGLVGEMTRLVLRRAIEAAEMLDAVGTTIPVAVNFTARDLLDPNLSQDLRAMLDSRGLDPRRLVVEITEDSMVVDFETSRFVLDEIREVGVRVSIDDFGTGYSSLQHLHRLPVDELKIDRSFVSRLAGDASARAIVRASVSLASELGLSTVAEGVEDVEALQAARALGCSEMQGYLVSKPVPLPDLLKFVREWSPTDLPIVASEAAVSLRARASAAAVAADEPVSRRL